MLEPVRANYTYADWAMAKVMDAAEGLPGEAWTVPQGPGLRSIRDSFVHIVDTQAGYLAWWDGSMDAMAAYSSKFDPDAFPDVGAIREAWERVHSTTKTFLDGLQEEDLARIYRADMPGGGVFQRYLWQMLSHVAAHGVQHRAELAAMLSAVDRSPGNLDQLFFFDPFDRPI